MATWRDVMTPAVQRVFGDSMRRQTTLIYVNDDENEIANVSQKMSDEISNGGRKIIFCKDVDEYEDFMCEMFSDDLAMIHVIVRDRLAEQVVMKTHTMKQIKCFFIFGKTPANDEQIIWAQQYNKVIFILYQLDCHSN
jgi:glutathionyl-hydroquinone reductase